MNPMSPGQHPVPGGEPSTSPLPDPVVPADLYDEHYYRNSCAGFEEWTASEGAKVSGIYPGVLKLARFRPGEVLVDLGTGRGEMLAVAVQQGAARAVGVEYSPTAVEMAHKTLAAQNVGGRAEVILGDARSVPLPEATADLVTMVDVVEHLSQEELERTFVEARRILKPGGRLFIHTMPNRLIYDVTYRALRALHPAARRRWPADPRNEYEQKMHINEQTVGGLRRALRRCGFSPVRVRLGDWVYVDFLPDSWARKLFHRAAALKPIRQLVVCDLFAEATKP